MNMSAEEGYEHTTCPSRKTTFTLLAEDAGDGWLQLLNLVMRCGTVKGAGKNERLAEALNAIVTVKLTGEQGLPPCFDIGADEFDAYSKRSLFNRETGRVEQVNQLDSAIDRLQRDHDTATGTVVLLGPADIDTLDDAPCIVSVTFNIVDERLYGTCVARSDDIYNAWPLNALSLIRLQMEVAQRISVPADSATFISHSAYIVKGDWGKARAKLDKWFERPLPLQADPAGLFFFGVESGRARALFVGPDVDTVLWEGDSADPEDLVRYIVDTMPWLAAQHVRYLGQEAAKLTRALREGEPYEQG
jgi:hypothetical protein